MPKTQPDPEYTYNIGEVSDFDITKAVKLWTDVDEAQVVINKSIEMFEEGKGGRTFVKWFAENYNPQYKQLKDELKGA